MAAGSSSLPESIFVSIASYRDNQCQYTIRDLFLKAKHPERIVVGVCFQVAPEDDDSFLLDLDPWADRIRTLFLLHNDAYGPCYARAVIQKELFQDEDYYFQIDSHFRFVPEWDEICLEQLKRCKSSKPLLTTYASSYTLPKDYVPGEPDRAVLATSRQVTIVCAEGFGDQNKDDPFLRIKTRSCRCDFGDMPPPCLFWTARFSFSRGSVVREVPYDPYLEYIFFGEEISMSARLWTAGWDLFQPSKVIGYHLGSRAHRNWFREVQTTPAAVAKEHAAKLRICGLLGTPWPLESSSPSLYQPPDAPFGLGCERTLAEYQAFCGVDFQRQVIYDRGRDGGLSADLFAPQWAEEERERLMMESQLKDVTSWAGKGGKQDVLQHQFSRPSPSTSDSRKIPNPETERARDLTRMRIHALRSQLQSTSDDYNSPLHGIELQLCRAFISLGQVERSEGRDQLAEEALHQGLEHLNAAVERAHQGSHEDAFWRGSVKLAEALAQNSLHRFQSAKVILQEALPLVIDSLTQHRDDEESQQLAHDVVDAIHSAHEQGDDRKGLEDFTKGLDCLLEALAAREPALEAVVPVISSTEKPPDISSSSRSLKDRLLEKVMLICIATGRDQDMLVVRKVFEKFRVARESPHLRRLLAMLQSAGHLLPKL
eukprot:TRINITY_DN4295_c0_g1_i1.p1 TRINITY_DN4295_c0_g1~~TRINITY_DN4295_c0_g1_i1.p1  ORF type:complete len:683 (-),score=123.04 TRINITY_DN4295_c0_g1_i1:12-1976(-)